MLFFKYLMHVFLLYRISVPPEVEVICSAILVITEGMKYPESGEPMYVWNHFRAAYIQDDYRKQFFR